MLSIEMRHLTLKTKRKFVKKIQYILNDLLERQRLVELTPRSQREELAGGSE